MPVIMFSCIFFCSIIVHFMNASVQIGESFHTYRIYVFAKRQTINEHKIATTCASQCSNTILMILLLINLSYQKKQSKILHTLFQKLMHSKIKKNQHPKHEILQGRRNALVYSYIIPWKHKKVTSHTSYSMILILCMLIK